MIREHDEVVLKTDIPEYGLKRRDMGTVVMVHENDAGYEVEFMALDGETLAVVTLLADQVRPIGPREIAHVRRIARA